MGTLLRNDAPRTEVVVRVEESRSLADSGETGSVCRAVKDDILLTQPSLLA